MSLRNRKRGITYIEIVVAMAFVAVCTASLADSIAFSTSMIGYSQRRAYVQVALQSSIDEARSGAITALPLDSTTSASLPLPGSRTATIATTLTQVVGKNLTLLQVSATWPESRGTRDFTDTMSFAVYMRGPDAP